MLNTDEFQCTAEIDARLVELEQEKSQLLALRELLQQSSLSKSDSFLYSPEQKVAIFRGGAGPNRYFCKPLAKQTRSKWLLSCLR